MTIFFDRLRHQRDSRRRISSCVGGFAKRFMARTTPKGDANETTLQDGSFQRRQMLGCRGRQKVFGGGSRTR
jgi:hypothetical protein